MARLLEMGDVAGLTLSQRVEGPDGGGVGGDADLLFSHGALNVHCQGAVYVGVQVVHHSGGERHIHETSFAVIAAGRQGVQSRTEAENQNPFSCHFSLTLSL